MYNYEKSCNIWFNIIQILVIMKKKIYKSPKIKKLGDALKLIKGGTLNKEIGGADGLFNSQNQPVSVP